MSRTVRRFAPLLSSLLLGATVATGVAGCADENEPSTWVKRLNDPATRVQAVARLVQFFEDKMSTDNNDRNGPNVKPLLDEIVQPMTERCVAGDLDEKSQSKLVKALADARDPRAESCYIKVLKDFKPEAKETEENVRWVSRAIGPMGDKAAAAPLMDVFLALRPSKLKKEPELYRDVRDALMELADPSMENQLIDRLNRPINDRKDVQNLRDEVYWQITAAELLGKLKSTAAVKPLIKIVLSPMKADIAANAVYSLIKIGKPSVGPAIAVLNSQDAELVKYCKDENLKAAAGPDGKVSDAAAKAADKAHVQAATIILAAIGREEAGAALLGAIDKIDKGDDLSRAVIARELPKVPKTPDILKTFQGIYDKTPTNLTIPPGSGAKDSLMENAGYFFDGSLVPWMAKSAVDLKGEAEDVDGIRASTLLTAIKLMTADQAADVEKLFSIKANGPDGKPTTLGKAYEKEYKIAKDLLGACGNKAECYIGKATESAAQSDQNQFQGIKALYMVGVLGTPDVKQKIVDGLPKITNAAVRFVASQVIDHFSPKGDPAIAAALEKMIADGEKSKDPQKIAGNAPFKQVSYRLLARAQ